MLNGISQIMNYHLKDLLNQKTQGQDPKICILIMFPR